MKKYNLEIKIAALLALAAMTSGPASAAVIVKNNNTDPLNLGSSWVGGVAPGAADSAEWDSTVTGPNTVALGADIEWNQLQISGPGGAVTINGGNTLQLDNSAPFVSGGSTDLTINASVNLPGVTGNNFLTGPGAGVTYTLNGKVILTNNVTRINFDAGGTNAGTWRLGGINSFTNDVRLGGSGNRLGIGSSSSSAGGPLGFGTYFIAGGSASIYTFAYNGNQTISNYTVLSATPYFSGSNNLTFAGQVVLSAGSVVTRGLNNLGSGTVTFAGGFTNGAIQVATNKFALGGTSYDPTGSGTSGNTKVSGVGSELILLSGGSINNRVRAHALGTLTIKPTTPNGQFVALMVQTDNNSGGKGVLAWDFTQAAPSTTVAPLSATGAQSQIFNPTDVIIRGAATQFLPFTTYPLFQYKPGTAIQMYNLNAPVLPSGLLATLADSTVFPNTLELVVSITNDFPQPPTITVQPKSQAAPLGANVTFSVTAVGGTPNLTYQWYDPSFNPITGGTNSSVTISNISLASLGDYSVWVSNTNGTTFSDPATLSLVSDYTVPNAVFWTGISNQTAADLNNYSTNALGSQFPVDTLAGKVIEYSAAYGIGTLGMNANSPLSLGAFHSNTNRGAGNGYNIGGSGPWTITRATVQAGDGTVIPNAALVVDHPGGGGWRFTPDMILDGGGDFVFYWNNDNWGEIGGHISEADGAANLIFTGNGTPVLIVGGSLAISGKITITNSTDLTSRYDFDISGGPGSGELVIYNDASHFDLRITGGAANNSTNYFKVKTLTCVGGAPVPAGVYTYDDLVNLGDGGYFYGNVGGGDKIEVTVGPVATPLTIASFSRSGNTLTLNIANGVPNGSFDLLESADVTFSSPIVNQSGTFDGTGAATVAVTVGTTGNKFFRVRESN